MSLFLLCAVIVKSCGDTFLLVFLRMVVVVHAHPNECMGGGTGRIRVMVLVTRDRCL